MHSIFFMPTRMMENLVYPSSAVHHGLNARSCSVRSSKRSPWTNLVMKSVIIDATWFVQWRS